MLKYRGDFIVASALNSAAILGLDFLENNQCCINTEQKELHLKGRALPLTRDPNTDNSSVVNKAKVVVQERVILPQRSMMEVMARVKTSVVASDCILLVEDLSRQPNLVVTKALVTPQLNKEIASIPIRLLNTSSDPVVLHKSKVASSVCINAQKAICFSGKYEDSR